jgi:hypothetical protein
MSWQRKETTQATDGGSIERCSMIHIHNIISNLKMGFCDFRYSNDGAIRWLGCTRISLKKGFGTVVEGVFLLVEEEPSYWLIGG